MIFEDCVKYTSFVKELVGDAWLTNELSRISVYKPLRKKKLSDIDYTKKFHPLAFLISQVDKHLQFCRKKNLFEVSEEIVRLSTLGEDLFILKNHNTKNLGKKISDLISFDKPLFDKTTYEICIAAAYINNGYPVEFMETRSQEGRKTADILINYQNGIEVECKKKDRENLRDIRNKNYWQQIMRKANGMMNYFKLNYYVIIKTQKDPAASDVIFILNQLQNFMKEKKEGKYVFEDRGIGITLKIISDRNQQIESTGIQFGASESLDYVLLAMETQGKQKDKVFIKNPRIFGFKSAKQPERITSIITSIKEAKKQLSGKRPGLIYVHLNNIDRNMIDSDFTRLETLITNLLKNNSTISGVAITSEFIIQNIQWCDYLHKVKVIKNELAKNPLPSGFEVIGVK